MKSMKNVRLNMSCKVEAVRFDLIACMFLKYDTTICKGKVFPGIRMTNPICSISRLLETYLT